MTKPSTEHQRNISNSWNLHSFAPGPPLHQAELEVRLSQGLSCCFWVGRCCGSVGFSSGPVEVFGGSGSCSIARPGPLVVVQKPRRCADARSLQSFELQWKLPDQSGSSCCRWPGDRGGHLCHWADAAYWGSWGSKPCSVQCLLRWLLLLPLLLLLLLLY